MKIQRFLLTIGLILASAIVADAQLLPRVNFGIKAGGNLSNFSATNLMSSESRGGFQTGAWSRISIRSIYLQPELYYMQKESRLTKSTGNIINNVTFKSIDLPILVGYSWGGDLLKGRLNTGPLISFSTGDRQTPGAAANGSGIIFSDQNYAWVLGAGVDVSRVSFDLRYEYGLNQLQNTELNSKIRPSVVSLSVAFKLFSL